MANYRLSFFSPQSGAEVARTLTVLVTAFDNQPNQFPKRQTTSMAVQFGADAAGPGDQDRDVGVDLRRNAAFRCAARSAGGAHRYRFGPGVLAGDGAGRRSAGPDAVHGEDVGDCRGGVGGARPQRPRLPDRRRR